LPRDVGVVIVAAGQGSRIGGEPKQLRLVHGVPLVLRAARPFLAHPEVHSVVLVLPAETLAAPPPWLGEQIASGRVVTAQGGTDRAASVRAGMAALAGACPTVLVHDGARPFASPAVIGAVIETARRGVGAVAAVPVTDTLKEADPGPDGRTVVRRTVPRAGLWRAQTPQGFAREVLERAHALARTDATDDALLVERSGVAVELIPDSPFNLKVTTAEDLVVAEALAALLDGREGV
jgi:2-C-methyl-D-erythritol 4-phosphate cytidylyltransferase